MLPSRSHELVGLCLSPVAGSHAPPLRPGLLQAGPVMVQPSRARCRRPAEPAAGTGDQGEAVRLRHGAPGGCEGVVAHVWGNGETPCIEPNGWPMDI